MSAITGGIFMNCGIRLHHDNNRSVEFFHCENRSCQYDKIDDAYSWEHVHVLGWTLKKADMWGNEKATKKNFILRRSYMKTIDVISIGIFNI